MDEVEEREPLIQLNTVGLGKIDYRKKVRLFFGKNSTFTIFRISF